MRSLLKNIALGVLIAFSSLNANIADKVNSNFYSINARDGTSIEVKNYYTNKNKKTLVFSGYLGDNGEESDLIDKFAERYNVITFSPRGSGNSKGNLTVDNFISDLEEIIGKVEKENGKKPYGFGISTGSYAFARLISESNIVERAVLCSPVINPIEQVPESYDECIRKELPREKHGFFFEVASNGIFGDGVTYGKQKFKRGEAFLFLKSLYDSKKIEKQFKSPTYVLLPDWSFFGEKVKNIEEQKLKWESLNARVDICSNINHWFSGKKNSSVGWNGKGGKLLVDTPALTKIFDFLEGRY